MLLQRVQRFASTRPNDTSGLQHSPSGVGPLESPSNDGRKQLGAYSKPTMHLCWQACAPGWAVAPPPLQLCPGPDRLLVPETQ